MNLYEMVSTAQGGKALQSLAQQYGLSPEQTAAAVDALAPAFSHGLKRTTSDPAGFAALLQALSSGGHGRYVQNPAEAVSASGIADGNGILGHLFGSKDLSRAVAQQASSATGIDAATLRQMLPSLASMVMGGLFQQTAGRAQAAQAGGFGAGDGNILGDLIKEMMKQGQQPQSRQQPQSDTGDNPLGQILKDVLGGGQSRTQQDDETVRMPRGRTIPETTQQGNPLEQILKDMFGGGTQQTQTRRQNPTRQAPEPENPFGDNPLGKIFEEMLRGGQGRTAQPDTEPAQRTQTRRQRNPYDDIFGQLRESGTRQTEEYQRGVEDIFEQYKRGMDRFR